MNAEGKEQQVQKLQTVEKAKRKESFDGVFESKAEKFTKTKSYKRKPP